MITCIGQEHKDFMREINTTSVVDDCLQTMPHSNIKRTTFTAGVEKEVRVKAAAASEAIIEIDAG